MNLIVAMGIPTTTDDRGYLLWLGEHWTVFVLPTIIFTVVFIILMVQAVHAWAARPPSAMPPTPNPHAGGAPPGPGTSCGDGDNPQQLLLWTPLPGT